MSRVTSEIRLIPTSDTECEIDMVALKNWKIPKSRLVVLTRSEHYINVGEIFLEKYEVNKNGQEIRVFTLSDQALEQAYQRLQAYKKQQAVTPTWEREKL